MNHITTRLKNLIAKVFNTSILAKSRLAWVDYLRGIAILLVVYRHVLIGLERSNLTIPSSLVYANMIFFSFRMPLFFILSGIFINGSIAKRNLKQLLYIKFENLLYPYLVWSVIQITLQILLSKYTNAERTAFDYTFILYNPRALDQFWYLPALFNATVVYVLLKTKLHVKNWMQLVIGIALYLISRYVGMISMMADWMGFYIFFAIGDSISKLFFQTRFQQFLKNPMTLLFITPVFILTQVYYLRLSIVGPVEFLVISLIGCVSMFVLSFRLQAWNILRFLRVLGFHSLFIYVMHVIVSAFVRLLLIRVLGVHNTIVLLFFGIVAGVGIPVIIYNTLIKNNIGWFLFSLDRPRKESPGAAIS
jgi:fucose 4-O-acetylase-like acetyltransferase